MTNIGTNHHKIHLYDSIAVGATSGFIASFLTAPTECISKIIHPPPDQHRMIHPRSYKGIIHCFRSIVKEHGFGYFHRVEGLVSPRLVIVAGLNFSLKEYFKTFQLKSRDKHLEFNEHVLINFKGGAAAGLFSQLISYPFKNLEANYNYLKRINPYLGDFKTFLRKRIREKRLRYFFNGLTISTTYQIIYRGLIFGIYDSLRLYLMPQKSYKFPLCFMSGYIAAFVSSTLGYPLHVIVLRMAAQRERGIKALIQRYFQGLFKGLWKGWRVNFLGSFRGALVLTFNDAISYFGRKRFLLY